MPSVSVYVKSFGHIPELMGLPRALVTRHPMGRPLGAPGDAERQRSVVRRAIELLTAPEPTIVELPDPFRPGRAVG